MMRIIQHITCLLLVTEKSAPKFAFAFWDDIFGADAPMREVTNPAEARPGDLIQAPTHWAIAVSNQLTVIGDIVVC